MIKDTQMPEFLLRIINSQKEVYKEQHTIQIVGKIPETSNIPKDKQTHWLKIPNVICVFADMKNSTAICKDKSDPTTAKVMNFFTETVTRIFHECSASYIDIKGDGAFALYNDTEPHRALATAVSIRTFCTEEFILTVKKDFDIDVGVHIGIDISPVLVRRCGLRRIGDRTDRQNELWAGKPVNMAAKLASLSQENEIFVSDRYFGTLKDEKALKSCGCPNGESIDLWKESSVADSDKNFDFAVSYILNNRWCETHGKAFCEYLLYLDET